MRTAFVKALVELAFEDENIWLLTGDLGFGTLEPFAQAFPDRFVNVGVAEQNMIGMATGLALSGKTVFVYSIANFATMRCLEQIRNDVAYHNAKVIIVAVGGGFTYGVQGYTHYAIEDLAVMSVFNTMTVLAPGDPLETYYLMRDIVQLNGPCYLRLGRAGDPPVHTPTSINNLRIGRALRVRDGADITLISTGAMLKPCVDAAETLATEGVCVRVISMHTLKPLDETGIVKAATETRGIITVEEHVARGGLGACVADTLLSQGVYCPMSKITVTQDCYQAIGQQSYMQNKMGSIKTAVRKLLCQTEDIHAG